ETRLDLRQEVLAFAQPIEHAQAKLDFVAEAFADIAEHTWQKDWLAGTPQGCFGAFVGQIPMHGDDLTQIGIATHERPHFAAATAKGLRHSVRVRWQVPGGMHRKSLPPRNRKTSELTRVTVTCRTR